MLPSCRPVEFITSFPSQPLAGPGRVAGDQPAVHRRGFTDPQGVVSWARDQARLHTAGRASSLGQKTKEVHCSDFSWLCSSAAAAKGGNQT